MIFSSNEMKKEAPTFLKRLGDTELYPGMTAKFTACCSGHPEPTVEWFREGLKLFPTERIKMETEIGGLLRLTIADIEEADLGRYSCRISNEHGNATCDAALTFDSKFEYIWVFFNKNKYFKIIK